MTNCEDPSCANWAGKFHTTSCKVANMEKFAVAGRDLKPGEINFHLKTLDASDKVMAKVDAKVIRQLLAENEKLKRDLEFEQGTNNFDATRLRRLATLVGASTPESDETLLGCAGTVIGSICREVEGGFKKNEVERKKLASAKSTLWAIAKSYDDDELRQRALEAYEELS